MKKQYIAPSVEAINIFAEDAVMLRMSSEGKTEVIWSQEKNNDIWNSDSWCGLDEESEN